MSIHIVGGYSIDVEENDGSWTYQLLDANGDIIREIQAGSAYTSSDETMRDFGKSMLEAFMEERDQYPGTAIEPVRKVRRRIIIEAEDGVTDKQAINTVRLVIYTSRADKFRTVTPLELGKGNKTLLTVRVRKQSPEAVTFSVERR